MKNRPAPGDAEVFPVPQKNGRVAVIFSATPAEDPEGTLDLVLVVDKGIVQGREIPLVWTVTPKAPSVAEVELVIEGRAMALAARVKQYPSRIHVSAGVPLDSLADYSDGKEVELRMQDRRIEFSRQQRKQFAYFLEWIPKGPDGKAVAADVARDAAVASSSSDGDDRRRERAPERLSYSNGEPLLAWYCGATWCHSDPLSCSKANPDGCRTSTEAFCASTSKNGHAFSFCTVTKAACEGGLSARTKEGATVVSACTGRGPTVPGQWPGNGWFCLVGGGFMKEACFRDLAWCQPLENQGFGSGRCAQQSKAACVVALDSLQDRYVSACYPTIEACKTQRIVQWNKADYSDTSECFGAP